MMKKYSWILATALLLSCNKHKEQPKPATQSPELPSPEVKVDVTPESKVIAKTYDGPFGLAKGISISEIEGSLGFKQATPGSYVYQGKPPKLVDGASTYVIVATPNQGLCKIVAEFEVNNVNGTGSQVKEKVDSLKDILMIKYGKPSDALDMVTEDVYRRNPEFWTMALLKDSAHYSYAWDVTKVPSQLNNNLSFIDVSASMKSISNGRARIYYEFDNFTLCQNEMKQAKASNL